MRTGLTAWLACLVTAALLAACGGGADRTKANLRLVNASSGYAALDLLVDDQRRFASVPYGQGADYREVDPDHMSSDVTRPGSATPLVSQTPAVVKRNHYTLLAFGREGALQTLLLDDNERAADGGKTWLRVVNAAPDAGPLDVYLTAQADPLADAVALQAAAAVGNVGSFVAVNSGTWRLRVTGPGAKSDLRLDVGGVVLASTQAATLVITPSAGGVLVNALLLVQQGAITAHAVSHARVRVAAGVPNGGTVSATVGGTVLMNAAGAPAVGNYALVPAGSQPVGVTVNGVALAAADVTLAAGTERTLLVHSPTGAPVASWLADDNRQPAASGQAKLRLVHGMVGASGALSLTADGLPVAGGVAAGTASAYAELASATGVALNVTAAGVGVPVFATTDRTLAAGAVYTVFVLGGPTPATGLLRQDR